LDTRLREFKKLQPKWSEQIRSADGNFLRSVGATHADNFVINLHTLN